MSNRVYFGDNLDMLREMRSETIKVVVVMRERDGETLPFVFRSEVASVSTIGAKVAPGSTTYADEVASWDRLHDRFLTKRINH